MHSRNRRPAFHDATGAVTGDQLIGKAVSAAEFLLALRSPLGTAIPALVTTRADAIALLVGGAAAGKPLAPIGPRLAIDELVAIVSGTDSGVLLTEQAFVHTAALVARQAGVRTVTIPVFTASTAPLPAAAHQIAFVLHTAGTTGTPKRVPITDSVMLGRARLLEDLIGFGPTTTFATGSPIHHIGGAGNLLSALTAGGAAASVTRFTAQWWADLSRIGATQALLVPSTIEMLLEWGALDHLALTTLIYGAAPIRPQTLSRVMQILPNMDRVNLFGQTEGSPITCLTADDHRRAVARPQLPESVGRAVPGLQLRIDSPTSTGVDEVLASAPHLATT